MQIKHANSPCISEDAIMRLYCIGSIAPFNHLLINQHQAKESAYYGK
jgi:hypothetical protein